MIYIELISAPDIPNDVLMELKTSKMSMLWTYSNAEFWDSESFVGFSTTF